MRLCARPVYAQGHAFGFFLLAVGVYEQDEFGFKPFGSVYGKQAHGVGADGVGGGLAAAVAHGAHPLVGAGIAATIERQSLGGQGLQALKHGYALRGRGGGGVAGEQVAFAVDGIERVVRGEVLQPVLPALQATGECCPRAL